MPKEYTNQRPSKVSVGGLHFIPFETKEVPDDLAASLEGKTKGRPHPLRNPKNPVLVPGVVAAPPPAPINVPSSLDGLDLQMALAQVKLCSDRDTLTQWAASEKRSAVIAAIEQRGREVTKA
jgi:hypothetical protein